MSTRQRISKYLPILRWTNELLDAGADLYLARVADPVRDMFDRSGFVERLGASRIHPGVDIAVSACQAKARRHPDSELVQIWHSFERTSIIAGAFVPRRLKPPSANR